MTTFDDFGLAEPILRALKGEGYTTPTPIQEQAIPLLLQGHDLLGIAQTGTGKTLAFAAPLLNHLRSVHVQRPRRGARVLVLAPTRELAGQIEASFVTYGQYLDTSATAVYGGVKIGKQIRRLEKGVDVLVATPGRLLDLVEQKAVTLREVEILVLDEADQMLDLGFIHALKRIVPMLPKDRQTLFFSATMPKSIADLASQFLTNPEKVSVAPESTTAERVKQTAMHVGQPQKQSLLKHVLMADGVERALVFVRTKHGADRVVRKLMGQGVHALAIHGNKSQPQRQKALEAFKSGECRVMIATEVAARGIDIDGLSHVINYDVPNVPEQYVHRIGRTGRAGAEGKAISFVARDEIGFMKDIERLIRMKVEVVPTPEGLTTGDEPDVKPQFEKRTSEDPRSRGGARGKGRGERGEHRSDRRGEGRGEGRGDQRGEGRGEGRGRPAARRDDRRGGKPKRHEDGAPRQEQRRSADPSVMQTMAREDSTRPEGEFKRRPPRRDDRPQGARREGAEQGRPERAKREGRPEGRFAGRTEGRREGRSESRGEGRRDQRPYGKSEGGAQGKRFGKPGGKPHGRPQERTEDRSRGRAEGRSDGQSRGKPSGSSQGKSYGKPQGKPAGKREGWSPDKPASGRKHRGPGKPGRGPGKPGGGGNRGGSPNNSRRQGRAMEPA